MEEHLGVDYPNYCLRGLPNYVEYIDSTGQPTEKIFRPFSTQEPREDGWFDLSVNWEDEILAGEIPVEEFTLRYPNADGGLKYHGGAVRIDRARLDTVMQEEPCAGGVAYERRPLQDNRFHGSILIHNDVRQNSARKKAVAGKLLKSVVHHIFQRYELN